LDATEVRPLIQDFLQHAQWFLFHRVKDRIIPGSMLMKPNGGGYLPMKGIYEDRVNAIRHYISLNHMKTLKIKLKIPFGKNPWAKVNSFQ
jgi:hypothetical protein